MVSHGRIATLVTQSSGKRVNGLTNDTLDRIFHSLSDRTRREVLRRLSIGPASVNELAAPFRMSRIAVSKHLRVLESARLISRQVDGRVHRCSLESAPLAKADRWLSHYRAFWASTLDALADYVEGQPKTVSKPTAGRRRNYERK